ncbi:MAG: ATP-binding protein [Pirellulaceae bacterium]|nr:ATP-binding protein [Pirellulaceae bacterium]
MSFQTTGPNLRFLLVLLSVLTSVVSAITTTGLAQEPQTTSESLPSEQATGADHDPAVIRSIAELKSQSPSARQKALKVDLEAQLIFTAPYWTVFFVQDGDSSAMVWCTDAASWELIKHKVGCRLRVMGTTGNTPDEIVMSSFEVTEPDASIDPIQVTNLSSEYTLPLNRFVELTGDVSEIFVSKHGTILSTHVGKVPVELEINDPIDVRDLVEPYSGATTACGCLALPPEPGRKPAYVLRIMNKAQMRSATPVATKPRVKRFKVYTGKVVYSDSHNEFVVETENQIRPVRSCFAFRLVPGDKVLVHELASVSKNASTHIESSLIEKVANEPLSDSQTMSVVELLGTSTAPSRVTLSAKVESIQIENEAFDFSLTSHDVEFHATLPRADKTVDKLEVRVGDLVSLTGSPLIEADDSAAGRSLKLYVASEADLKFKSTPTRLPLAQIATIALVGCALLGSALTWNWLLRRQVQRRTARLNEVSSHLRKAFEAVNEGVLVNDCEQRISGFNQQFVNMFGTQPTEGQLVNLQLSAIEDLLVNRVEFARIRQHIQDNKSPSTGMIELRSPNRTLQVFASAIMDNDGSYQGNLWSFEDVTEKLSLENKLIQSQKMEAVGQLSGGIAHDFNNLLTIIRGSIMMMKIAAKTNSPSTEFAESAEIAVDRAAELTQHLLDFSRRSTLQLQTVDANSLLKRVYLMIRRSIDSSIEIEFKPMLQPTYIKVDVTRLEQVLINLCINARDALPKVGGRIQLTVRREEQSDLVVIVVEDNGSGISPEVQKRMFEPFFTTKQPGCGTGLGLSMAIGVVEQLGGNIECRSEIGKGTAFQISLPSADSLITTVESNDSDTQAVQPLRILLVDDEEQIRLLGRAILKSLGHQTVTAANGREAVDLLTTDPAFHVVLLDLTMPILSGKETFQEIRRRWPTLPVAICSGYLVSVDDWVEDNQGKPPAVLAKPYLPDELNQLLAELTRPHGQTQA